jgi:hypothetical protein
MQTENLKPQTSNYKHLTIANHNNKLSTDCFIVIDIAPPESRRPKRIDLETRLYSASSGDGCIFVKIIDLLFLPFIKLTDHFTLWANGQTYIEFKTAFFAAHPNVTEQTEMIIYYYQRCNEADQHRISETRNGNEIKIFC